MTNNRQRTLILGLGNILMGDEGVGVHVVRALEKKELPDGVECLDGGTGGFILLEPLENADRIILIDAADDGNAPGTVTRTMPRFSRDYPPTLTAHDIGVKDLLDAFYMQGGKREVILYADHHRPETADFDGPFADRAPGRAGGRARDFDRSLVDLRSAKNGLVMGVAHSALLQVLDLPTPCTLNRPDAICISAFIPSMMTPCMFRPVVAAVPRLARAADLGLNTR